MKTLRYLLLIALLLGLLLTGCAGDPVAEVPVAPTAAPVEAATEAPTEAPTEPPEPTEPEKFTVTEVAFPTTDAATGTLKFYFKDKEIYAGAPVSQLLDIGVTTYENFDLLVEPWHMTSVQRVRIELEDTKEADLPFVFFIAMNTTGQPQKISDCTIYSITINTDNGVRFGSGNEAVPFVTGQTKREEILAAYGEPDYTMSRKSQYTEIAYYEPFNCAYFSFKDELVRQVTSYYSANVFGNLIGTLDYVFENSYFGNDCYILMNQYMDVKPYLTAEDGLVDSGVMEALTEKITMAGAEMQMGIRVADMPSPFVEHFKDQLVYLNKKHYVRVGRNVGEEFYFININGQKDQKANELLVKGVITRNQNHSNWGKDNAKFYEFQYENLTNNSTIADILEQYGMPYRLHCTSYARGCFAWLFYKDNAGNMLEIKVDPILDQIIELQFTKYYEGEKFYD